MDYKKEIIEMLDKIKVDQILRYIYIIISDILKENKNEQYRFNIYRRSAGKNIRRNKNPQNKEGLPSASLVYSVINLLGIQANMIKNCKKLFRSQNNKANVLFRGKKKNELL